RGKLVLDGRSEAGCAVRELGTSLAKSILKRLTAGRKSTPKPLVLSDRMLKQIDVSVEYSASVFCSYVAGGSRCCRVSCGSGRLDHRSVTSRDSPQLRI